MRITQHAVFALVFVVCACLSVGCRTQYVEELTPPGDPLPLQSAPNSAK